MAGDPVQHRQREAGGLAGTGLGAAHDVAAGEDGGNGLCLDGGRFRVAGVFDGPEYFGQQPEVSELH